MFDIGWTELVVIGIVALIAIGPKELPAALRTFGNWMGKVRRMAAEFQGQFQEAMREAEMADIKKQVDDMTATARDFTSYDPMTEVRKEIDSLASDPSDASSPRTASAGSLASSTETAAAPGAPSNAPAPTISGPGAPTAPSEPQSDLTVAADAPPKPSSSSGSGA